MNDDQPSARSAVTMTEVSISSARASVMVYDDVNKKWLPSGSSSGLSKVHLYHHQLNNTFRVVGRKLQDHEIVINCAILRGLKYNQATVTFHQWRDNKQVYGLNFSSKDDADAFAKAMLGALDVLSNGNNISRSLGPAVAPTTQGQPIYQHQPQPNTQFDEDMGYSDKAEFETRTMTRDDVAVIQERRMSQQNQATNGHNAVSPSCPSAQQQQQQQQQQQSGHHRTSSAPPAPNPQMPPQQILAPVAPPAPPAPPCPPAPMMNFPVSNQQYAQQQAACQNQQGQSQPLCGGATSQFANNGNSGVAGSQYSASPGNLYGSNGSIYGQTTAATYATVQQPSTPSYAMSNQYGSNGSINQYAQVQPQYASVAPAQAASQSQYAQSAGNVAVNPYGTPAIQYQQPRAIDYNPAAVNSAGPLPAAPPPSHANVYAPVGSSPNQPRNVVPKGPVAAAPPPPPPPPVPASSGDSTPVADVNSLAAALQAARSKKKQQSQAVENSGSSTSSSSSGAGNYGTLGRASGSAAASATAGGGMASMMDEMAKTLARRRAAVQKKGQENEADSSPDKKVDQQTNKSNNASSNNTNNKFSNGAESPKAACKKFGSASEDTLLKVNGVSEGSFLTSQEMEAFKSDLMKDIRKELQKIKLELIDVVKAELNRR